jgi:hypothetical protein
VPDTGTGDAGVSFMRRRPASGMMVRISSIDSPKTAANRIARYRMASAVMVCLLSFKPGSG